VCWPSSRGWDKDWSSIEHRVIRFSRSSYQLDFLNTVLRQIRHIRAGDVEAEKDFTYARGGGRVDFTVVKGGVRLAIEVDGLDKSPTGQPVDHNAHMRLTERQNELGQQGWQVLRFTNTAVRMHPDRCRKEVERALATGGSGAPSGDEPSSPRTEPRAPAREPHALPDIATAAAEQPTTARANAAPARRWWWIAVPVVATAAIVIGIAISRHDSPSSGSPTGATCSADLPVKGNESQSGDRIYHVPGGRYYDDTWPEQCFADARAAEEAGYRPSRER
jgi:hypothetical protein